MRGTRGYFSAARLCNLSNEGNKRETQHERRENQCSYKQKQPQDAGRKQDPVQTFLTGVSIVYSGRKKQTMLYLTLEDDPFPEQEHDENYLLEVRRRLLHKPSARRLQQTAVYE